MTFERDCKNSVDLKNFMTTSDNLDECNESHNAYHNQKVKLKPLSQTYNVLFQIFFKVRMYTCILCSFPNPDQNVSIIPSLFLSTGSYVVPSDDPLTFRSHPYHRETDFQNT